jgi:hypothetical protein
MVEGFPDANDLDLNGSDDCLEQFLRLIRGIGKLTMLPRRRDHRSRAERYGDMIIVDNFQIELPYGLAPEDRKVSCDFVHTRDIDRLPPDFATTGLNMLIDPDGKTHIESRCHDQYTAAQILGLARAKRLAWVVDRSETSQSVYHTLKATHRLLAKCDAGLEVDPVPDQYHWIGHLSDTREMARQIVHHTGICDAVSLIITKYLGTSATPPIPCGDSTHAVFNQRIGLAYWVPCCGARMCVVCAFHRMEDYRWTRRDTLVEDFRCAECDRGHGR